MIDSINFIIKDVYNLDFDYLKAIGIKLKMFQIEKNNGFIISGYYFKYKNVDFTFYVAASKVEVKTNL